MNIAIWWIRRDLRLTDNEALTAALNNAAQNPSSVLPAPNIINTPANLPTIQLANTLPIAVPHHQSKVNPAAHLSGLQTSKIK